MTEVERRRRSGRTSSGSPTCTRRSASGTPLSVLLEEVAHEASYSHRLWYQLTVAIQQFIALPSSRPLQVSLYQHFIRDFEGKIQPLKLVEIAITVSQRYEGPSRFFPSSARAMG